MGILSNVIFTITGFGIGIYVYKNCHFEKVVINPIQPITRTEIEIYYPSRWKTEEESKNRD